VPDSHFQLLDNDYFEGLVSEHPICYGKMTLERRKAKADFWNGREPKTFDSLFPQAKLRN
jgi:hypothetical protein